MDETRAKRDRSLSVRGGQRVAPCITTSAARARVGARLVARLGRGEIKARPGPGLEPVQSEGIRVYINTVAVDPREYPRTDKDRSRLALVSSIPWPQP